MAREIKLVLVYEQTASGAWRSETESSVLIGHRRKVGGERGRKVTQTSQWPAWAEKLRAQELNKLNHQPREEAIDLVQLYSESGD